MATDNEVDDAIDALNEFVSEVADDKDKFSQSQSIEIYESVASTCRNAASVIRQEMGE